MRSGEEQQQRASVRRSVSVWLWALAALCLLHIMRTSTCGVTIVDEAPQPPQLEEATSTYEASVAVPLSSLAPGVVVKNWRTALHHLRESKQKYVIINAKNGLGNRLRALASAMSVAEWTGRNVLLIWARDLHLNCSVDGLFAPPLPFALLHEEIPTAYLSADLFQIFNYMRPEPGAIKDEAVDVDPDRHLYFKSAFMMNHPLGDWRSGGPQRQIRRLRPRQAVARLLVTDRSMVGLHVRNVFDAPRDHASNVTTEGEAARQGAEKEYGKEGSDQLLRWRRASHWTNFVGRMHKIMREHDVMQEKAHVDRTPMMFYLAADSEDAYAGLTKRFPNNIVMTKRDCSATRCDFRDCSAMIYSLADMMNLAQTRLILGSGYSSYSEVAAQMGGNKGRSLPMLMAGKDFGRILSKGNTKVSAKASREKASLNTESFDLAGYSVHGAKDQWNVRVYWDRPF